MFGGSCQIPLAAFATETGDTLHLRAMVATPDGRRVASAEATGPGGEPEQLGRRVADLLVQQDAHAILAACQSAAGA